jgi:hypothetical protein
MHHFSSIVKTHFVKCVMLAALLAAVTANVNSGPSREGRPKDKAPAATAVTAEPATVTETVAIPYEGLLVVRDEQYVDGGGAHGVTTVSYYTIDTVSKRLLDPAAFLAVDADKSAATAALRTAFTRLRPDVDLFDADSPPSGSFHIPQEVYYTPEGPGFCWQDTDIAAHYFGPLEIVVPYAEMNKYMSPDWKRLWDKK